METITPAQAIAKLRAGEPLGGVRIPELDLHDLDADDIRVPLVIRECRIDALDASHLSYHTPLLFEACLIGTASFSAAYLLAGAQFVDCEFTGQVTFDCGGHNAPPNAFVLSGCTFAAFANFFDSWFMGPFEVRECHFQAGTNLLGNVGLPYVTTFGLQPVIENNSGRLDLDGG